jgi:TetR/AcrR family transcriptional regulator, transcriptional repressor for nem operon
MSSKRDELEQLATELVQTGGIGALSFRTLADRVGVKSSSVHYYFPEKNDLTAVLIQNYTEGFAGRLQAIAAREKTLKKKLLAYIGLFEEATSNGKLCLCGMLSAEIAVLDDASRALLVAFFKLAEDWLQTAFEGHADQLAVAMEPKQLAQALLAGLEGAILLDRVQGDQSHFKCQKLLMLGLVAQ